MSTSAGAPLPKQTNRLTETQALALMHAWRRELRCQHWNFRLQITREIAPFHGDIDLSEKKTCAHIKLLCPTAANPAEMEPLDMEVALVHEMMHAKLGIKHKRESHLDILEEQAIHHLSTRLVAMKRELRKLRRKKKAHAPVDR